MAVHRSGLCMDSGLLASISTKTRSHDCRALFSADLGREWIELTVVHGTLPMNETQSVILRLSSETRITTIPAPDF